MDFFNQNGYGPQGMYPNQQMDYPQQMGYPQMDYPQQMGYPQQINCPQGYNQYQDMSMYQPQQYDNPYLYGVMMDNGKRFQGYNSEQLLNMLRLFLNNNNLGIEREVNLKDYPMPDANSNDLYGNLRHACADRLVCFLKPNCFYIPEMDLNIVYYYCTSCHTLYTSKEHRKEDAMQRKEVLKRNNYLLNQQEKEMIRQQKACIRDAQRYEKEVIRNAQRCEKEMIRQQQRYQKLIVK